MKIRNAFLTIALTVFSASAFSQINERFTISVIGQADTILEPDMIVMSIELIGESPKGVKEAMEDLKVDSRNIIEYLQKEKAVSKVETNYIRTYVQRDQSNNVQKIRASQSLVFVIRDMDAYERISSEIFELGAYSFNNIRFESSMREKVESKMRTKALMNAEEKARNMLNVYYLDLIVPLIISEVSANGPGVYRSELASYSSDSRASIAPAGLKVSSSISVKYLYEPKGVK